MHREKWWKFGRNIGVIMGKKGKIWVKTMEAKAIAIVNAIINGVKIAEKWKKTSFSPKSKLGMPNVKSRPESRP